MTEAVRAARIQLKREREARSWEREKMLYDKLLTPNTVRLGLMCGIIAYSTWAARSKHNVGPVQSALAFALPGLGIPLIAADAGIKDKYALGAISGAAIGYTTGQMLAGWGDAGLLPSPSSVYEGIKDMLPEWMIPG